MDIPEDVLRLVESVFEQHDGGDTVGYMAAAILADRKEQGDWKATLRYCEGQWSDERGFMIDRIQAVRKVRDGYADQAKFADIDCAVHFREFVRRIDAALSA